MQLQVMCMWVMTNTKGQSRPVLQIAREDRQWVMQVAPECGLGCAGMALTMTLPTTASREVYVSEFGVEQMVYLHKLFNTESIYVHLSQAAAAAWHEHSVQRLDVCKAPSFMYCPFLSTGRFARDTCRVAWCRCCWRRTRGVGLGGKHRREAEGTVSVVPANGSSPSIWYCVSSHPDSRCLNSMLWTVQTVQTKGIGTVRQCCVTE